MKWCGAKRRNKEAAVRGGEHWWREAGDWQRMLVERTRTRAEKERVKARWEPRRGWGGLGGGEEKEQRKRKADVEEVGNWWSRKLGYSCCESMCLCCVSVCVRVRANAHMPESVCECEYEWWAMAVNETVYQINMAIISQMTVASTEEQS